MIQNESGVFIFIIGPMRRKVLFIIRYLWKTAQAAEANGIGPTILVVIVVAEENIGLAAFSAMVDIHCDISLVISGAIYGEPPRRIQRIDAHAPGIILAEALAHIDGLCVVRITGPGKSRIQHWLFLCFFRRDIDSPADRTCHENANPIDTNVWPCQYFDTIHIVGRHSHLMTHAGDAVHTPAAAACRETADIQVRIRRPMCNTDRWRQRQHIHHTSLRLGKGFHRLLGKSHLFKRCIQYIFASQRSHILFGPDHTRCDRCQLRGICIIAISGDDHFIELSARCQYPPQKFRLLPIMRLPAMLLVFCS